MCISAGLVPDLAALSVDIDVGGGGSVVTAARTWLDVAAAAVTVMCEGMTVMCAGVTVLQVVLQGKLYRV